MLTYCYETTRLHFLYRPPHISLGAGEEGEAVTDPGRPPVGTKSLSILLGFRKI